MPVRRSIAAAALAVPLLLLGAGCAPDAEPVVAPTTTAPEPVVEPTTEPTVTEATFTQPELCSELLAPAFAAEFEQKRYVLLGGPEGKYGEDYLDGPTPEESAGGISCFWGDDTTDVSEIIISVAPLSPSNRARVVTGLEEDGLNESTHENSVTFGRFGDDSGTSSALYNVLRTDSWISVLSVQGGQDVYNHLIEIADGTASLVYQ